MGARFLLLRHGQIEANKTGRWHGSTDSPLTRLGKRQAKRTGRHLNKRTDIAAVYASPLQRCMDTARLASSGHDIEVQALQGLQEMSIGEWEDMPFQELHERHDFINRTTNDLHFAAPSGESLNEVAARVTMAFKHIDAQHDDGETVLVVSHGVALAVALAVFLHDSPAHWTKYHFNNCSLTEFVVSPEAVVHSFNEHTHL